MNFFLQEGAAVMVDNSRNGSGGTIFVQQRDVAQEVPKISKIISARKRCQPQKKEAESENDSADDDGDGRL